MPEQSEEIAQSFAGGFFSRCQAVDRLSLRLYDQETSCWQVRVRPGGQFDEFAERVLEEGLEFSGEASPMSELLLNLLGAVAQFERSLIRERQREGIEAAKKRGVYKGRKKALSDASRADLKVRRASGEGVSSLPRKFDVSRQTVYSYLSEN